MTKTKQLPDTDLLRASVIYDPESGLFIWRNRPEWTFYGHNGGHTTEAIARMWNSRWAGKPAFAKPINTGYLCGAFNNVPYQAHRIAWKMVTGCDPNYIDHINGVKDDNRLSNLREVSRQQNSCNRGIRCDNKSGFTGVTFKEGKWRARIHVDGKELNLGTFSTAEDAADARHEASRKYGYHQNHGRSQ